MVYSKVLFPPNFSIKDQASRNTTLGAVGVALVASAA